MTKTQVSQLYVSIFNRASEKAGNEGWQAQDMTMQEMATEMLDTDAAKTYFGDSLNTNLSFIKHIYLNTLSKTYEDDKAGIDGWVKQLDTGAMTRGEVVSDLIGVISDYEEGGSKYAQADSKTKMAAQQFSNRVEISNYAADTILTAPADYAISMSFDGDLIVSDDILTLVNAKVYLNKIPESTAYTSNLSYQNDALGTIANSTTYGVSALDSNQHWADDIQTLTFSFNSTMPSEYNDFWTNELTNGWTPLTTQQKDAVRLVMQDTNKLLGIELKEVSSNGTIRFNVVDTQPKVSGFSLMPGNDAIDGDIFLSSEFNRLPDDYSLDYGGWGHLTIVHELGHALGLKHPFEDGVILEDSLENTRHTVMSYTSENNIIPELSFSDDGISIEYQPIFPDFYSLYDIAALQSIYGVNENANTTDNIYKTNFKDYKIQTIWDAGGKDTIDLSNTKGSSTIDLREGSLNSADQYTLDQVIQIHTDIATQNAAQEHNSWIAQILTNLYLDGNLYTGIDNLAIATGTIIENVITGLGDDTIIDNEVDNQILTYSGDDHIYLGNGGYDYVDAGDGYDSLYLDLLSQDVQWEKLGSDSYMLSTLTFSANINDIEVVIFQDTTISIDNLII